MNPFSHAYTDDEKHMARAITLAKKGRGHTAPNPCVGAVLVSENNIVAEGWHHAYGKLHAERECLHDAQEKGIDPRGMTMYVTLEPCSHHGKTPPCTEALIEAGIGRVVIGALDFTVIAGGGADILRSHDIQVDTEILKQECKDLIADFWFWQNSYAPFNILKMAATLDGKIAGSARLPEAVSCQDSFQSVHELRSIVGAVIVGGNTFYGDNPSLTCRLEDESTPRHQPLAVIVTSRLPENLEFNLLKRRPNQTLFWTTEEAARSFQADRLRKLGVSVWGLPPVSADNYSLALTSAFERLRFEYNIHYTLCEGGGVFAMQLLLQGLADEVIHFLAPRILGDNSAPSAYAGRDDVSMNDSVDLRMINVEPSGTDLKITYRCDFIGNK